MARVTLRITGTQLLCQDEHPSLLAALGIPQCGG
ncbi:putative ferredoxin [Escherichia coli]|uniref:Putative ferredoxin n=1 Tax=Escherichia coli TaxID=562 RepID=A0A2X1MV63_ECOLX|nr:putative ferredoxin [Escherichia coli]STI74879.1 putative ferredoxin [Escherichia coli]STM38078.1 putative ferredoxin [Escherichia coli]